MEWSEPNLNPIQNRETDWSGFSLTQTDYTSQPVSQTGIFQRFKFKKKLQIDFIEISWLSRLMDIPFIFREPDFWQQHIHNQLVEPFLMDWIFR